MNNPVEEIQKKQLEMEGSPLKEWTNQLVNDKYTTQSEVKGTP